VRLSLPCDRFDIHDFDAGNAGALARRSTGGATRFSGDHLDQSSSRCALIAGEGARVPSKPIESLTKLDAT